jgi:hypothetical protein
MRGIRGGAPIIGRMIHTAPFRFVALLLATVLVIVAATPARAEAIDALTIVAIAGLAVAGIILIAYLVIANVEGSKSADGGRLIWVACAADDCATIPGPAATALIPTVSPAGHQAP